MARTINEQEYSGKRNEILAAAMRLVYTKGYERMTIQDILADLKISSGAFYHYFDSKPAVLEAFIERMQDDSEKPLLPVVQDPHLTALEKLQRFFAALDQLRIAHKADVVKMLRVWYTDDNAIVRQKVDTATLERRTPLLNAIVRQGVEEGLFTTPDPDQAGEIILSLLQGMGNTHARLLLALEQEPDMLRSIERLVAVHAAFMHAIERVVGVPPNSLVHKNPETAQMWVGALQGNDPV